MNRNCALTGLCVVAAAAIASGAAAAENLLKERNGDFAAGLAAWVVDFPEHDFLKDNTQHVAVVQDGARQQVLKFTLSQIVADNWGVQALSRPIRVDPKKRYQLTVSARSTGPAGRIYVMGKRRKPGAPTSETPANDQVRDVLKGPVLSFVGEKGSAQFSNVKRSWSTDSVEIPPRNLTELAFNFWASCEFVEIHLVGIGGKAGEIFFDDVKLEESGPVDRSQIRKTTQP